MRSLIAAALLAGIACCAPHTGRPHHQERPRLFNPRSYHPRYFNGTIPLAKSSAVAGAWAATPTSPYMSLSPFPSTPGIFDASAFPSIAPISKATQNSVFSSSSPSRLSTGSRQRGKVQAAGINISGCDFGCSITGTCGGTGSVCPSQVGPTQMQHFSSADGLNIFRLPVGWQYLVNNQTGGPLDQKYFGIYDAIVQSCLQTGSRCIVDIHNYARWNGQIVGQGGPPDDDLVNLWTQLAQHYVYSDNIVFGIMNEPHTLDINVWRDTVQAVVTAIRQAGATTQWILLPGTAYTSATGFQISSAPALSNVKNPDGTTTNLVYDVHKYYDSDGTGTSTECVTDHVLDSFQPLGDYLRSVGRQAFLSETGGGNTDSCAQYVCSALEFINSYSDVYLGWTGWAAGSFDSTYNLTETPTGDFDTTLVSKCIAGKFK